MWRLREQKKKSKKTKIKRQIHINWTSVGNCPCGELSRHEEFDEPVSKMAAVALNDGTLSFRSGCKSNDSVTVRLPFCVRLELDALCRHLPVPEKKTHTTTSVRTQPEQNSVSFCISKKHDCKKKNNNKTKQKPQ